MVKSILDRIEIQVKVDYEIADTLLNMDYGKFTDKEVEGVIPHNGGRYGYKYFLPANPETGKEDYKTVLDYYRGEWCYVYVVPVAHIKTQFNGYSISNELTSGGITTDTNGEQKAVWDNIKGYAKEGLSELTELLLSMGFSQEDIDNCISKIQWDKLEVTG